MVFLVYFANGLEHHFVSLLDILVLLTYVDFRPEIFRGILTKYRTQRSCAVGRSSTREYRLRLSDRHFLSLIPQTSQSKQPQRKWLVYAFHGVRCDISLCLVDCVKGYSIQRWTTKRSLMKRKNYVISFFLLTRISIWSFPYQIRFLRHTLRYFVNGIDLRQH